MAAANSLNILKVYIRSMPSRNTDLGRVASVIDGYVETNLAALCREVVLYAPRRTRCEVCKGRTSCVPERVSPSMDQTTFDSYQ